MVYSESKTSLETPFQRWDSESWGEYFWLAGVGILNMPWSAIPIDYFLELDPRDWPSGTDLPILSLTNSKAMVFSRSLPKID